MPDSPLSGVARHIGKEIRERDERIAAQSLALTKALDALETVDEHFTQLKAGDNEVWELTKEAIASIRKIVG